MELLHIGIIGTGWFSKVHADILSNMKGVTLSAVCATSQEKADRMAADYHAVGYASLEKMLDNHTLDAVYICVPPMAHGEIERQLIARGIPFLVEKPLGTDASLPQSLLEQVTEKQLLTSVGYHFRYSETASQLKDMLQQEHRIGMVLGQWMGDMPQVAWWRRQEGSGGQFIEQTTHLVDLLRYCAGEVEEVFAMYGNRIVQQQYEEVSVADIGTVTLKLSSGVIANLSNTCVLPGGVSDTGLSFYTNQGILDWRPSGLEVSLPGVVTKYSDSGNPYVKENEAFLHALRTGDTSGIRSTYEDAFKTQQVTFAALTSAQTGRTIKLS